MATVLLVEDHHDFRTSLADILQLEGWTALTAETVDDAWATACSVHIDVVLCDVLLLGSTGLDLKTKFAGDSKLSAIPFVFMTGYPRHVDQLAPAHVLLKPFSIETLRQTLLKAISDLC